jgi:hypothetical protein
VTRSYEGTPFLYPTALVRQKEKDFTSGDPDMKLTIDSSAKFHFSKTPKDQICQTYSFYVTVRIPFMSIIFLKRAIQSSGWDLSLFFFPQQIIHEVIHGMGLYSKKSARLTSTSPIFLVPGANAATGGFLPITYFDSFVYLNLDNGRTTLSMSDVFPARIFSKPAITVLKNVERVSLLRKAYLTVTAPGCTVPPCPSGSKFRTGAFFYDPEFAPDPYSLYTGSDNILATTLCHSAIQDSFTKAGDLLKPSTEYLMSFTQIPGGQWGALSDGLLSWITLPRTLCFAHCFLFVSSNRYSN